MGWIKLIAFVLILLALCYLFDIIDFLKELQKVKKERKDRKVEEQYWALKNWIENLGFDDEEKVIIADVAEETGTRRQTTCSHQFSVEDVLNSGLKLKATFPLFETVSEVVVNKQVKRGIRETFTDCFAIQIDYWDSEMTIVAVPKSSLAILETVNERNCKGFELVITGEVLDSQQTIFIDDTLFEAFAKQEIDTYFMDEYARHQSIIDDGSFSEEIRSNSEESLDIILKTILAKYKEIEIRKIKEEKDMAQSFNSAQQAALNIALVVYKKNRE
ncbi:hypothetical protein FACS1894192_08170 [Bacilli bacterium]|nr:hypothetical protein FACS1894192_08170 [Bacilli bacterium]